MTRPASPAGPTMAPRTLRLHSPLRTLRPRAHSTPPARAQLPPPTGQSPVPFGWHTRPPRSHPAGPPSPVRPLFRPLQTPRGPSRPRPARASPSCTSPVSKASPCLSPRTLLLACQSPVQTPPALRRPRTPSCGSSAPDAGPRPLRLASRARWSSPSWPVLRPGKVPGQRGCSRNVYRTQLSENASSYLVFNLGGPVRTSTDQRHRGNLRATVSGCLHVPCGPGTHRPPQAHTLQPGAGTHVT